MDESVVSMEIARKYRTKCPPREHEEAVRMLLEGIGKQKSQTLEEDRATARLVFDHDERKSLSSLRSQVSSEEAFDVQDSRKSMKSKSTSTMSERSASSESILDAETIYKAPIPSRTIAVQCDLKISSAKRDGVFDGSMQASSISSTRYGFYNFSPETLERRRKLQRSISSRNIDSCLLRPREKSQIEAPTSMSELSSSLSSLATGEKAKAATRSSTIQRKSSSAYSSSSNNLSNSNSKNNHAKSSAAELPSVLLKSRRVSSPSRDSSVLGSMDDNSSTARARIDTLSRRPKTALSYVSSSRLRDGDHSPSRVERQNKLIKGRATSQQILSRPRTPAPDRFDASSGSDSELEGAPEMSSKHRREEPNVVDKFQVPKSEEIVLVKRGQSMTMKPPRAKLVSSEHNEQVRDFRTLERPTASRAPNALSRSQTMLRTDPAHRSTHQLPSEPKTIARDEPRASHLVDESEQMSSNSYLVPSEDEVIISNHRSQDRYLRSYRNQASAGAAPTHDSHQYLSEDAKSVREPRRPIRDANGRMNSMSLTRRPARLAERLPIADRYSGDQSDHSKHSASGYYTASRRPATLSRSDRAYSQTQLTRPTIYGLDGGRRVSSNAANTDVARSTSMRHISRLTDERCDPSVYTTPNTNTTAYDLHQTYAPDPRQENCPPRVNKNGAYVEATRQESDDSESPRTRTWANPSARQPMQMRAGQGVGKSSRSYSMREINNLEHLGGQLDQRYGVHVYGDSQYRDQTKNEFLSYNSSSESSSLENAQRYSNSRPLDYDSQHMLNESGLPDASSIASAPRATTGPSSYLGIGRAYQTPTYLGEKAHQVNGRAMSQQSLTRPTMPLTGGRRRAGSNSGSDVGGSSMSLVSRLQGRYENAHTRSPVVMYIPNAPPKSADSSSLMGKSGTIRKSSRSKSKTSLHSRRGSSRNGSDSDSSSLLRTLVRPKSKVGSNYASRRSSRMRTANGRDDDDENTDAIGQLASEMDSYKFRRRYSVPKDAKINWFSRLKQKVSTAGK